MIRALLLRFDAPLMSFGGVCIDTNNPTDVFPARAMLTGLLANALGYERSEESDLTRLQTRIRYAARRDRVGERLSDFHTVDLDSSGPMGADFGWTTAGKLEIRRGGDASEGTHIRRREYLADTVVTVALTLIPADESPRLEDIERALHEPARPLFLGRRCCPPSEPIGRGIIAVESLRTAIETTPRARRVNERAGADGDALLAIWPEEEEEATTDDSAWARVEDRDWSNAIHAGRRFYVRRTVFPPSGSPDQENER